MHSIPLCALAQNNKYMLNNNAYTHTCNHTLSKQNIKSLLTVKLNSETRYKKQLKSVYSRDKFIVFLADEYNCSRNLLETTIRHNATSCTICETHLGHSEQRFYVNQQDSSFEASSVYVTIGESPRAVYGKALGCGEWCRQGWRGKIGRGIPVAAVDSPLIQQRLLGFLKNAQS